MREMSRSLSSLAGLKPEAFNFVCKAEELDKVVDEWCQEILAKSPQSIRIAKLALIWTTMHVPAMSVPVFKGPAGMPVPVYLVGKRSQDRELFAHARWVNKILS